MKITDVRITKLEGEKLKGFASITFDDCFVVKGVKIMLGSNGLFISMPSMKGKDNEYHDICFPITADTRKEIQDAVLSAFGVEPEEDDEDVPDFSNL